MTEAYKNSGESLLCNLISTLKKVYVLIILNLLSFKALVSF